MTESTRITLIYNQITIEIAGTCDMRQSAVTHRRSKTE